jgi:hypothetical protein
MSLRPFSGSYLECMYALMTYGIPHHLIAMSTDGSLRTKHILEWIKMRKHLEALIASDANFEHSDLPALAEVILGRGKPAHDHPGNLRLHDVVDECLPRYNSSTKQGKTEISTEVVQRIKATSGRFLAQIKGVWMETSDVDARDKVSHLFRNRRRRAQLDDTKEKVIAGDNVFKRLKLI